MPLPTPSQLEQGQNAENSHVGTVDIIETAVKDTATVTVSETMSREPNTENNMSDDSRKLTIRECLAALDNETSDDCKLRLQRIVTEQKKYYSIRFKDFSN